MVDSPSIIVLPGSNMNIVGSTGKGRCSYSGLIRVRLRIRASIGKMIFISIGIALPFSLHWVLGSLGPLNILISGSRGLEVFGALNHMACGVENPCPGD
jgi:hypothetical protein